MEKNKNVIFRRIRGRLVPISVGIGAGIAAAKAGSLLKSKTNEPDKLKIYASRAANIASGAISALPIRGKLSLAKQLVSSIALDSVSSGFLASAIHGSNMSNKDKVKRFAKEQALATGMGYAVFGAGLLAQKNNRKFLGRALRSSVKFGIRLLKR